MGGSTSAPSVLYRGRIDLCNRGVYREGQPYHAAAEMDLDAARGFLAEAAATAASLAHLAMQRLIADFSARGHRLAFACVLEASGRPLPELSKVLAAHPLIHTAEGLFFRDAVRQGCASSSLTVTNIKERDLASLASTTLKIPETELLLRVAGFNSLIGPPWRQDEKLCALAAWLVLAAK